MSITRRAATTSAGLTAVPDRRRRLSDGALVDASIRARLLGIQLLSIDATIVLAPAEVTRPSSAALTRPSAAALTRPSAAVTRPSPAGGDRSGPTSARSIGLPPPRSGATSQGLSEAVRSINEGEELLARARGR